MSPLYPPALDLPDEASVRWTSLTKFIRNPEENWPAQICERPIIAAQVRRRTFALIADPEAARAVLTGGEQRFPKCRIYDRAIGQGVGMASLSVAQGKQWQRLRRALAPMFRPEQVANQFATIRGAAERAVARWTNRDGMRLDASLEMVLITLEVMWRSLFGERADPEGGAIVAAAAREIAAANAANDVNRAAAQLARLADLAGRRPGDADGRPDNPFSRFTRAAAPDGELSRTELFDNARTLLGAGHETTALTLTWALWLIGQDADAQRRAQVEIDAVTGGRPVALDDIGRLTFLGQVLHETLRLFPPATVTVREAAEPVQLAGEDLPAGAILAVCFYALHRHRRWWDDPTAFRPERFAPGSPEPRHRFAFLPFSAGQHVCLAGNFGWVEAVTIFATLLKHFDIAADAAVAVRPRMAITLRPDRAVPVTLWRR